MCEPVCVHLWKEHLKAEHCSGVHRIVFMQSFTTMFNCATGKDRVIESTASRMDSSQCHS